MGFIILFAICCALVILVMLGFIVYTIATGQFHALPKEIIITAIPSLILFLMFKFCKNGKNKTPEKNVQERKNEKAPPLLNGKVKDIMSELPERYFDYPLVYKYNDVKICMIEDFDMSLLKVGYGLTLKCEPENEYDKNAVAVYCYQVKIGYMFKNKLQDMANDFSKKKNCIPCSYISKIDDNEVCMNLGFYGKCLMKFENKIDLKLSGTSKKEIQEELFYSCEGNEILFEYDYIKETYAATDNGTIIGYAPKSKNGIFENPDNYYAEISKLDTNENDKYYVIVSVKYN